MSVQTKLEQYDLLNPLQKARFKARLQLLKKTEEDKKEQLELFELIKDG